MGKTLFDKIWDRHVVQSINGGQQILYIDRHLIHEVTSPQAFDGLRRRGLPVFRPQQTIATADHNVPTIDQHLPIKEPLSRKQVETLTRRHQKPLARAFLDLIDEAFNQHRQWRETGNELAYTSWANSFKVRVTQAIETWWSKAGHAAGLLLKSLTQKSHQWWYFLDHPQVPPDNNRAERSLRLAVTKRKVAGGSRSWEGFRRTATLLSAIESCRASGRSAIEFFGRALSETVGGHSGQLSLIPRFN